MAEIFLNPNSIYNNSQANILLNKNMLYAFTRSISAVNDSIYGMQPTKEQLLSGFDLSDCFAVNPLSSNGSLCANVYVLDNSVAALKFFSSRPFVVLSSTTELDEKAQNPFAVYLTPIVGSENRYEWIYIMPSLSDVSDWDLMVSAYSAWEADKEGFRLSSFGGKWELIGSTSFTDEEISALYFDIKETIDEAVSSLNAKIETEKEEREASDEQISGEIEEINSRISSIDDKILSIDNKIEDIDDKIEDIEDDLSTNYETKVDAAAKLQESKTYTDDSIASARTEIEEEINDVVNGFNDFISGDYEPFKDFVQNDLVNDLNDEISNRIAADKVLENAISSETDRAQTAEDDIKRTYLPLSGGEITGDLIVDRRDGGFTKITVHDGTHLSTTHRCGGIEIKSDSDSSTPPPYEITSTFYYKDGIECEDRLGNTFEYNFPAISGDTVGGLIATREWTSEQIPTDLSAFTNSPGYLTAHQPLSDYYTKQEADGKFLTAHQDLTDYATKDYVQEEISDFITVDDLSGLATKEEATLSIATELGGWICDPPDDGNGFDYYVEWDSTYGAWMLATTDGRYWGSEDRNATSFVVDNFGTLISATRQIIQSYVLGSQTDKPLAPAGDYALKEELNVLSNILSDYAQISAIPEVNDGTFSISCNGQTLGSFSANQSTNNGVNISVPTKVSDLQNDVPYLVQSDLNDYALTSQIPTVNDGTLTINHNNQLLGTFSANTSINAVINIDTPTKTSDLQNDVPFLVQNDLNDYALTSQIPTVNDGTLDIQVNGSSVGTFSANQSGSTTANISVLTPENGTLTLKDSGGHSLGTFSANQGTDTEITLPVSPTVGDGKLTINYYTAGGTGSDEFTANQTTDTTINLPAPGDGTLTINYNGNQQENFSANQSSSSSITIDPPNDGTLFITVNQQSVGAFSANSAGNVTADIDLSDYATTADVDALDTRVGDLEGTVQDLSGDVEDALDLANDAKNTADDAKNTADEAKDAADAAQQAAEAAQQMADNALTAANTAGSVAVNADNTARGAQTAAQNAQDTANAASTAASNAQSAADAAQNTADSAQSTADAAQQTATTIWRVSEALCVYIDELSGIYVKRLSGDAYDLSVERLSVEDTFIARNSDNFGPYGEYGLSIDRYQTKLYANEVIADNIKTDRIDSTFGYVSELSSDKILLHSTSQESYNELRYSGHSDYNVGSLSLSYRLPVNEDVEKLSSLSDIFDYTLATREWVSSEISSFALIDTVADAYAISVLQDGLTYTVKQGTKTVGTINVLEDTFISAAAFEGTILVLSTNTGEIVSTDLSGLAKQYYGDDGSETRISVGIENNTISAVLLDEYLKVDDAATLSAVLSDYVKKSDISTAIESELSDYDSFANGSAVPESISAIINWNKALHSALKNLTTL